MNKWLQDFAFRIKLDWGVFVVAGLATLLIAPITMSFHAVKAALSNPVNRLKTE
jgi:putative ABC transport system permease protein